MRPFVLDTMPIPVERLSDRLRGEIPLPRPSVVPELSYGRHRGPVASNARLAAVAVTLYREADEWFLPLTLRPTSLQHHAGQVCLPGGRVEAGESTYQAALREFEEELGVPAKVQQSCGELSPQYVYASNNFVHPVVAVIDTPGPWQPDPTEVDQVISLPLTVLLRRDHRATVTKRRQVVSSSETVDQLTFRAPAYQFEGHLIWGATALILDQLAQILLPESQT